MEVEKEEWKEKGGAREGEGGGSREKGRRKEGERENP